MGNYLDETGITCTDGSDHGPEQALSSHSKIMRHAKAEESVLEFKNLNFVVKTKENQKRYILKNIKGTVHAGHVMAILGPSGAGKTTLLHTLTLSAFYGTATGTVSLNGYPLNQKTFNQLCYHVEQHDSHWPYLTCIETLRCAAELYHAVNKDSIDIVVDDVIRKMGLEVCKDTRNARLSGGQRKRLSIGVALLKSPTVLYLDEPTSGLDAAAAKSVMGEIVRIAREERLIVVCTIHQPSSKVYSSFDGLMILSRGREAYNGNINDATEYFDLIGYPCPEATNPAEYFLDLVNSDFTDESIVTKLLDDWENVGAVKSVDHAKQQHKKALSNPTTVNFAKQISILFRRHMKIICRDPILYLGRCVAFLIVNMVFAFVYWSARENTQDQAAQKVWIIIWLMGVPTNMACVAVYLLNDEFKSISREVKNGMLNPFSYIWAKTVLVIPILFMFSLFSLGIPMYAIQAVPKETFGAQILLFTALFWVFESLAEFLSVAFDDPILGMLALTSFWFASFLFGGFMISLDNLNPPFNAFYYMLPYSYFMRSSIYELFDNLTFAPCYNPGSSPVCIPETSGLAVLDQYSLVMPLFTTNDEFVGDLSVLLAMGAIYKLGYIIVLAYKTSKYMQFQDHKKIS